jgi:pimeloyl-ACP methyl ester carboxylesterase
MPEDARMSKLHLTLLALLACLPIAFAQAGEVEEFLPNGLRVTAEYTQGRAEKPVVLIVHGFLQTRHFSTVERVAAFLAEENFPVLNISLSLGIDGRKQSLACDAINTHAPRQAEDEIGFWLEWLQKKGHRRIVVAGHSLGATHVAALLNRKSPATVAAAVLIAPVYMGGEMAAAQKQEFTQKAQAQLSAGNSEPGVYRLSFCANYTAPPQAYLEYLSLTREHVGSLIKNLNLPVFMITGSEDTLSDLGWIRSLAGPKIRYEEIQGGNHMFDAEQEFDLNERLLNLLNQIPPAEAKPSQ